MKNYLVLAALICSAKLVYASDEDNLLAEKNLEEKTGLIASNKADVKKEIAKVIEEITKDLNETIASSVQAPLSNESTDNG